MHSLLPSNQIKVVLVALLMLLAVASFFYNQFLIDKFMEKERADVELWARAIEFNNRSIHQEISSNLNYVANELRNFEEVPDSLSRMIQEAEASKTTIDFVTQQLVLPDRFNIPTVVVDETDFIVHHRFIDEEDLTNDLVDEFSALHEPVVISFGVGDRVQNQYIYYGESPTIRYLRFFPYVQFGILALLIGVGYTTYRSITRSEQSNLWVGMTKEAAHQLGTPLSSMYGWLQLLKDKFQDDEDSLSIVYEIQNDVSRLKGIAERFNKIGSQPELKKVHVEPIIDQVIEYMERRLPQLGKNVQVRKSITTNAKVELNPELFQWAIENLIKNSMDAIKESTENAFVAISVIQENKWIKIDVEDSGTGMDRKQIKKIFKPGYSTKKRGWGLGLSLTKRIIEEYHKGKIYVLQSEINNGTTIRITLPVQS